MNQNKEQFSNLLDELKLIDIQLMHIESYKNQPFPEIPEDVSLLVNFGYPKNNPFTKDDSTIAFMPRYQITLTITSDVSSNGGKVPDDTGLLFRINLSYYILFKIDNAEKFETYFKNEEIRNVFMKYQIDKILRPYLRQQYSDLANRHSLHVPTLPLVR